jgi:hypothetical protein
MRRREMILSGLAGMAVARGFTAARGDSPVPKPDNDQRRKEELQRAALAQFPFPRIECAGTEALAKWEELKRSGRGTPVVIGDDESIVTMMDQLAPGTGVFPGPRPASEILAAAAKIQFPEDLHAYRRAQEEAAVAAVREMQKKDPSIALALPGNQTIYTPPLGDWPEEAPEMPRLSIADGFDKPLPKVSIATIPTTDWTEIPAYLNWGNWNACPPPEYHVAAWRLWRERYGIELVGLSFDTINFRGAHPPQSRDEALALARVQYDYCNDLIEQGAETLSNLASALMASDWWYFWWD